MSYAAAMEVTRHGVVASNGGKSGDVRSFFARRVSANREPGKQEMFGREAIPHMHSLYKYAFRLTGEHEEAGDLLQETCLKAYRFFDRFRPGSNCRAWLFRVMKNSYINHYRRAQRVPERVEYDSISDVYHALRPDGKEENDLSRELFDQMLADEVIAAMEKLPPDFRTVVLLCDLEDFTYAEVAEFVDCPIGTVRSRLHRGHCLLREYLFDYASAQGCSTTKCRRRHEPQETTSVTA